MSNDEVERRLRSFLSGDVPFTDMRQWFARYGEIRMSGDSIHSIDFHSPPPVEIVVRPLDVQGMLRRYLAGTLDAHSLRQWAAFIVLSEAYAPPEAEGTNDEDLYEPMWYVLQQLSTPEIDGAISPHRARKHLDEIKNLI